MILLSTATTTATGMTVLRLLFDNDRVRVSDLRLPPGESFRHTLQYPTVRWQVDDGYQYQQLQQTPVGGTVDECTETTAATTTVDTPQSPSISTTSSVRQLVPDKTVFFDEAGTECRLQNAATPTVDATCKADADTDDTAGVFRQIWFEVKQPPRRSPEETRRILETAIYTTNVGTELLLENDWVRVWDFYLQPAADDDDTAVEPPHHHVLDYVFVYVAPGRLLGYSHDGKPGLFDSINEDGDVTWFDIPDGAHHDVKFAHGGKNGYNDRPMREYLVELK